MTLNIKPIATSIITLIVLIISMPAYSDQFNQFRKAIDCSECYSYELRGKLINELKAIESEDVEKQYLLGMLYFSQAVEAAIAHAKSRPTKPNIEDITNENEVKYLFSQSENYYDIVENNSSGYKYIYCKYGELYRYWGNEAGLRRTTRLVGSVKKNDRTNSCKSMLEDAAEQFAANGYTNLSKAVYEEAVTVWKPYPKYMLEALGDIENVNKNRIQAVSWWNRCIKEAQSSKQRIRCEVKVKGGS